MKLVRWGEPNDERFGLWHDDAVRDLGHVFGPHEPMPFTPEGQALLTGLDVAGLPRVAPDARLGAPIPRPGKFVCVGLNYADHAEEAGMAIPSEPILFMKATNAIAGPHDDLRKPRGTTKLDWEVELGLVIGTGGTNIERDAALGHVGGYCVVNDLSARDWQLEGTGQWVKGKSFAGAGPVGPWLVTPDEVPDPSSLRLGLSVDGEVRQDGSTSTMIFDVATIVSEVSRHMTLEAGDLIATGTPPGVGMGLRPPVYLRDGQTIRAWVEGLGEQSVTIRP